jgi:lipopolysaccharide/colanic/teichoic acid biosynthesis glycosyltransferase
LTVEFAAESAHVWGTTQGTTPGRDGAEVSTAGPATLLPDTLEFRFPWVPTIELPYPALPDSLIARGRRGLAGLLARVPRRTFRQLVESTVAIVLLLLLSPLLLATAVAIKLTSRGPVLFRQARVGLHRDEFRIFKFRTMHVDNDDSEHRRLMRAQLTAERPPDGGAPGLYKLANDPRVTPIGGFLRQFSIDELPQLLNVLRGEMSLVGPRPYVPWEAELFPAEVQKRFSVRPGMTGLWQVSGRSSLDYRTALNIDVFYTENKSLWLDLRILLRTAIVIFDRSKTK